MNVGTGARTAAMPAFSAFSKEKIFPKFLLNLFLSKHLPPQSPNYLYLDLFFLSHFISSPIGIIHSTPKKNSPELCNLTFFCILPIKTRINMQKFLLFLLFPALLAFWETNTNQEFLIEGHVETKTGLRVEGIKVAYKDGAPIGYTNERGEFKIQAKQSCAHLTFSTKSKVVLEKKVCASTYQVIKVRLPKSSFHLVDNSRVRIGELPPIQMADTIAFYDPITYEEEDIILQHTLSSRSKEQAISIRGSRKDATNYVIDGVSVQGNFSSYQISTGTRSGNPKPAPGQLVDQEEIDEFNTEDYSAIIENRFLESTKNPLSTFSIDVDAASYANMRRFINNGQKPPKDAIRLEEMVNYFDYEYPQPKGEHPFEIITELSACPWQPKHQLLHIGLQGKTIPTENLPASNLVFLIDVSGSMNQPNKLPPFTIFHEVINGSVKTGR